MIDQLFRYLWFVIVVIALIAGLRAMSWADENLHGTPPEHQDVRQRN